MLKLRRGVVVAADAGDEPMQQLEVELGGERRPALSEVALHGASQVGDEVVVNVEARDLGLGSGGSDIVHCNLTRGLAGEGLPGAHVMKLNYTSLQHAVVPVEDDRAVGLDGSPVAVCGLHGQLAPVAWAAAQGPPRARIGYIQTAGGALPGALSKTVRELRRRGLLAGHLTAGPTYGGEAEAMTVAGALVHGRGELGWDAAICAPGPGIIGSGSALGHGGLAAMDSAHAALALRGRVVLVARMSSADTRPRHRGLSHHTEVVLGLLLGSAIVALPAGESIAQIAELGHEAVVGTADLEGYCASGLPATTMGRGLAEDPLFFAAALAGGSVLADQIDGAGPPR
ncbi:MAG TPA: DUF3866 family protein [Solirubrobacteraceae bacterium]|nr:DUF3866 family protein [Solirubrobacteraceae bacterium]